MFKQFLKDSAIYGLSNLLSRAIGFFLIPLYTRVFSPSDYGMIDILTVFASLINVTVALEISQAVARFFSEAETREQKTEYASTSFWFTLASYTFFLIISIGFAGSISAWLLESQEKRTLLLIAVSAMWVNGLFYLVQNQLRWELKPIYYTVVSLVFTFISLGTTVFLVLVAKLGVISIFWGQCAGGIIGTLLGLILARQSYGLRFSWQKLWMMLGFSLPLVPSSIGVMVTLYIDRVALKQLMTLSDVGRFGVGYRIASITGLIMVAFQSSLTPLVYNHYREPGTPGELARIFRYFVFFSLLGCLGLGMFAPEIMLLITTQDYYPAAAVVPFLAPAVLLYNMYIFTPGLGIAKRTGWMAMINIFCAVENTALNFLLIPHVGIVGAGLATLTSASSMFCLYMAASQKLYYVPHNWRKLGISSLVIIGVQFLCLYFDFNGWLNTLIKVSLFVGAGLLLILIGLLDISDVKTNLAQIRHS